RSGTLCDGWWARRDGPTGTGEDCRLEAEIYADKTMDGVEARTGDSACRVPIRQPQLGGHLDVAALQIPQIDSPGDDFVLPVRAAIVGFGVRYAGAQDQVAKELVIDAELALVVHERAGFDAAAFLDRAPRCQAEGGQPRGEVLDGGIEHESGEVVVCRRII